jgi:protein SCO1
MKTWLLPFCLLAVGLAPTAPRTVSIERAQAVQQSSGVAQQQPDYRGGIVSPPMPKPKFTLTDTSGAPFDFWAQSNGYVTILFFGYTRCPDVCPLQMQLIAQALKKMPPATANQFKVVFVTTDPARDTSAVLRTWLDHFDKHFIGLSGTQAAVDAAQTAANLSPGTKSAPTANGAYGVNHSAFALVYTKDNYAHVIYPAGVTQADLVHDFPLLAKENWSTH